MTNAEFFNVCPSCGDECRIVCIDDGIGHYEYWGITGVDIRKRPGTDCCEAAPKEKPYWDTENVDWCHINGGDQKCSTCQFIDVCMDSDPV